MSHFLKLILKYSASGIAKVIHWLRMMPMGLLIIGSSIIPLLIFDWSQSDAALPDGALDDVVINPITVPYLPIPFVEELDLPPPKFVKTVTVGTGDTLIAILTKEGVSAKESHRALGVLSKHYDPRRLQPGQALTLHLISKNLSQTEKLLASLTLRPSAFTEVNLERSGDAQFRAEKRKIVVRRTLKQTGGTIQNNLYVDATNAGVPAPIIMEFIRIYSWDVDFQRGIQPGDSFELLFEKLYTNDGKLIRYGNILFGNLILRKVSHPLHRYRTTKGLIDYFDEKGRSARKALMRTPINGARLSSGFGKRRHPILGYNKMHRGLDFAAPRGTPVYAAGDGRVVQRGRNGGYGHYIRIRHNSEFETAYAHLSRYHSRARRGKRVRQGQIIGYVGTSGRSTGPHLHYEILRNKRQVNPLKVKMPSGIKLSGKELVNFTKIRDKLMKQHFYLSRAEPVAR